MTTTTTTSNTMASASITLSSPTPEPLSRLPTPTPTSSTSKRSLPLLARAEIARRIASGQALIIRNSLVLNVTSWTAHHPGGALALLHFVGRDATDEMEAYHSEATLVRMDKFAIGRVEIDEVVGWKPLTPPIALGLVRHPDGEKGHWAREGQVLLGETVLKREKSVGGAGKKGKLPEVVEIETEQLEPLKSELDLKQEYARSKAYRELKSRVVDAGLFNMPGPLAGYGSDILRISAVMGASLALFFYSSHWAAQCLSAALLGLTWQQLAFVVHDAGHSGITGNWAFDRGLGMFIASWIGGLSLGWWCDNHDIHHLVTNHPEHDPDIQHIPFFAISKQFFGSLWSTYYKRVMALDPVAKTMITVQHKLYYIILSLARFNLYANSYIYLLGPKPKHDGFWWFEISGIACFWVYFSTILRHQSSFGMGLAYLLISHVFASPVHVQIVLSHFACSTDDLGPLESFPSRQLRTTMDVICSPDIEFIHGGLHLQVTHHLFPRLPRHNLRKASLLVKDYCKEHEIEYREHYWVEGNRYVLGVLQDVANQLTLLKQVADKEIAEKLAS